MDSRVMQFRDERSLVEVASQKLWNSACKLHPTVPSVSCVSVCWYQREHRQFVSLSHFWSCVLFLVRGTPPPRRVGGWHLSRSKERYCVLLVRGHDTTCVSRNRDFRVVGSLVNPTLGCKDIQCTDTCLVLSVILFIQLFNCMDMHTRNPPRT